MIRVSSGNLRNNHHSLGKKSYPISLGNSNASNFSKQRKLSTASIKQNIPDLDKLINDLKICPTSRYTNENISKIFDALKHLEKNPHVQDEVKAVSLLMQSIEKKLSHNDVNKYKMVQKNNKKLETPIKIAEVSPIKQYDDGSSRILYTNFSLKDIQKEVSLDNSLNQSIVTINRNKTYHNAKMEDQQENQNNLQIKKLNQEIKALQNLLEKKMSCNPSNQNINRKKCY